MLATPAEIAVLRRLAEPGATYATVANELGISRSAVESRLRRMYRRLGVNSALQAWVQTTDFLYLPPPA